MTPGPFVVSNAVPGSVRACDDNGDGGRLGVNGGDDAIEHVTLRFGPGMIADVTGKSSDQYFAKSAPPFNPNPSTTAFAPSVMNFSSLLTAMNCQPSAMRMFASWTLKV
jgi:hypothetical protein